MSDSTFQQLLTEAIVRYDLKYKIANEVQAAPGTVARWALGETRPHPSVQTYVEGAVTKLVDAERQKTKEANNAAIASARSINDLP